MCSQLGWALGWSSSEKRCTPIPPQMLGPSAYCYPRFPAQGQEAQAPGCQFASFPTSEISLKRFSFCFVCRS